MREIYLKSFVYPFYKAYLGFFILATVILGVFMEMKQHLMIAERIMENPKWFAAVIFIFITYSFLQLRFQIKLLQDPSYGVFQKLSFLSFSNFLRRFFNVWLFNHALILLYSLLMTYVGLKVGAWEKVSFAWFSLFLIAYASMYFSYKTLHNFYPEKRINRSRIITTKPYFLWFLYHLKENRPLLLILIKAFSLLLLSAFFYSYYSGGYDSRWLAFGLLISCFVHYPIWLEKWEFGENKLYLFRNLPLEFRDKISLELLIFLTLTIPESALILFQGRGIENKIELIYLLIFWLGLNPGIFALCHLVQVKQQYNLLYLAFFVIFLMVLFGINPALLALVFLIPFGYTIFSPFRV